MSTPGQDSCESVGVIVNPNGCVTNEQGQILGSELSLMEMTDVEYTHLQHIIQTHMEAQAEGSDGTGDVRFNSTVFAVGSPALSHATTEIETECGATSPPCATSPYATPHDAPSTQQGLVDVQEIKMVLVSNADGLSGERTPTTCGEVPGSVLAKVRGEVDPSVSGGVPVPARPNPPARVRLENRFNCSDIPRQQDVQSTALSNFLTMLQHSTEAQEAAMHPQMQKWVRSDRSNPIELSHPYAGSMFNPIAGFHGQGFGNIPHVLESNKHQGLIIPKNFTFSYRQERVTANAPCNNRSTATEEQVWVKVENAAAVRPAPAKRVRPPPAKCGRTRGPRILNASAAAASADLRGAGGVAGGATRGSKKRGGTPLESNQRRERHNSKERDRRRRIRFCCDELNLLVPFCNQETDKATTLQWTTAFLKFIREAYGDSIKQEFQSTFCGKTGLRLKPSDGSSQLHRDAAETQSAPQQAEQ